MTKIYKYPLVIDDQQTISMPPGAKLLSVQVQNGVLCLWAHVVAGPAVERVINIVGTGHVAKSPGIFVGTVQMDGFVWHVFDDGER